MWSHGSHTLKNRLYALLRSFLLLYLSPSISLTPYKQTIIALVASFCLVLLTALIRRWLFSKPTLLSLQGKTVLLTGASRGLGRHLAKQLDKMGCRLILWDIDQAGLDSLRPKLDPKVMHVLQKVDVADEEEIKTALESSPVKSVDIVIANAGIMYGKSIIHLESEEYERVMHVNLFQHLYMFKQVAPNWEARPATSDLPPTFVMVSSVCGLMALTSLSAYCSSKFGVVGLAEGMRLDLRRQRSAINTLLVMPFLINTKMFNGVKLSAPASWFLAPLDKREVANRIIEGIQTKRQWLVLPWTLHAIPLLLALPIPIRNFLYDCIGESTYMDTFRPPNRAIEKRKMKSLLPMGTQVPDQYKKLR